MFSYWGKIVTTWKLLTSKFLSLENHFFYVYKGKRFEESCKHLKISKIIYLYTQLSSLALRFNPSLYLNKRHFPFSWISTIIIDCEFNKFYNLKCLTIKTQNTTVKTHNVNLYVGTYLHYPEDSLVKIALKGSQK